VVHFLAGLQARHDGVLFVLAIGRQEQIDRAANDLVGAITQEPRGARVPTGDDSTQVFGEDAVIRRLDNSGQLRAGGFRPLVLGDVTEQDRHPPAFRGADAVGGHIVPTAQGPGFIDESRRLAGQGHLAINLKPMGFMRRGQVAHQLAPGIMQAGLPFKRGIDFQEAIIHGVVLRVENHFDDAEALNHCVEQGAITRFGLSDRRLRPFNISNVADYGD
jgi:hypothetical protein